MKPLVVYSDLGRDDWGPEEKMDKVKEILGNDCDVMIDTNIIVIEIN